MVITCHGYFRVSARNLCAVIIFLNQQRERHDHIGIQFTDRHFLPRLAAADAASRETFSFFFKDMQIMKIAIRAQKLDSSLMTFQEGEKEGGQLI
jgi:hypothetical protein